MTNQQHHTDEIEYPHKHPGNAEKLSHNTNVRHRYVTSRHVIRHQTQQQQLTALPLILLYFKYAGAGVGYNHFYVECTSVIYSLKYQSYMQNY